MFRDKKALVTGSAGFIGSHLVDTLIKKGLSVYGVDNYSSGSQINRKVKSQSGDINDDIGLEVIFDYVRPDYVFHLAAAKKVSSEQYPFGNLETNALGTLNLLKLSHKYDVKRFFYASTGSVYGHPVQYPQTEKHTTRPISPYGIAKLIAEGFCRFYHSQGLNITVLRYFHVYGPRQRCKDNNGGVVGIFCRRAVEGLPLIVHGDGLQIRSFTYVKDVIDCNIKALKSKTNGEIFNCASGLEISINELAEKVIKIAGDGTVLHQGERHHDIPNWQISNKKIKSIGKASWISFDDGLKKTYAWYKKAYG